MHDQEPTVRSRTLGRLLVRELRDVGMTQTELGKELGWSVSMVSRMITGKRPVSAEHMSAALAVLRITGSRRQEFMEMARRPVLA